MSAVSYSISLGWLSSYSRKTVNQLARVKERQIISAVHVIIEAELSLVSLTP